MFNNKIHNNRREWLKKTGLLSAGFLLSSTIGALNLKKNPTILLVSGWQDVNIGDIAHTPGLLHILETFMPESEIILWKRSDGEVVKQMLNKYFPRVSIIYGHVDAEKDVENPEILKAFNKADLMIHGSGPMLVGADNLACWMKHCPEKPFGVFGATLENPGEYHQSILKKASFIFTRETLSIAHLKKAGIEGPHVQFAPDATFYLNIRDDEKGLRFLNDQGLENRKFICVVPRLRYTPYHQFNPNKNGWNEEKIKSVEATNAKYKEADHAKLREAMISWVRQTGYKILVCPEMTYQVDIMDELLINPLPDDVKPLVLKRGYWLPDEAASVYSRAFMVLSFECHSPIIAAANKTPMFYLSQPEDTIKGQMYYDLGFDDWTFEIEQTEGSQIAEKLMEIWNNYQAAQAKLHERMNTVGNIYAERVNRILDTIK